ncbi:hypothetical protein FS842_006349 [Serendipita sp. 407]|nr:hypothetical protein FS842_006349 [Serendipita sp. 407]
MQPDLAAHNFSGYTYPSNTNLLGGILVANSADVGGANATLKPLFDFAEAETKAGRPMLVQTIVSVLPSVFGMFSADPATVDEGSGSAAILGSRLVPLDIFKGARLEAFTTFLVKQPFSITLLHVAGGKVNTVSRSATAVNPSWRRASHHIILATGWGTNTTFALRNVLRKGLTQATQTFAELVPGFGAYANEADIVRVLIRKTNPNGRKHSGVAIILVSFPLSVILIPLGSLCATTVSAIEIEIEAIFKGEPSRMLPVLLIV